MTVSDSIPPDRCESALARISNHLDGLSGMVFLLEETLGATLNSQDIALDSTRLTELQSMDFIRQSLEDLALLIHFFDTHVPECILDDLPLNEMAGRLKLNSTRTLLFPKSSNGDRNACNVLGDVDLF